MKKCITYWTGMQAVVWLIIIKLISFLKISFIIGSQLAHFSAVSIATPLVGLLSGITGCWVLLAIRMVIGLLYNPVGSLHVLAFYVPGFCASLYLVSEHISIRLIVPIVCMVLFIAHPVGFGAFAYALYWLIPILLYFVRKKSFFLQALGSTFVAHAVGSVIWLYTVPMSSLLWLGLIPIVIVERLLFASGIAVTYLVFCNLSSRLQNIDFLNKRNKIMPACSAWLSD